MIKFEKTEVVGWEHAIRGMRNPMNSWDKSDSCYTAHTYREGKVKTNRYDYHIGPNDLDLMKRLRKAGTDHRKYLRMIVVYVDITAPLYWWKEFDTYKIGTVSNSCSTMHTIHKKELTIEDFSHDKLAVFSPVQGFVRFPLELLLAQIKQLNLLIKVYNTACEMEEPKPKAKDIWDQIIQLLPSSYNQKRTVMLNYETLNKIYKARKNHKLDEWSKGFMEWIETLPYAQELIIGE